MTVLFGAFAKKVYPKWYSLQIYDAFCKKTNSARMKNTDTAPTLIPPMKEKELQRLIRRILRNTDAQWRTGDDEILTVLSVGEWNHHEGPDFLNMALLAGGKVLIGHGEVHWRSSDWEQHGHSRHPMYQGLLLHIVVQDNRRATPFARHTLVIPEETVLHFQAQPTVISATMQPREIESALRDEAERRFLRKAEYAGALVRKYGIDTAWETILRDFCERRLQKKHLPKGIKRLAASINSSGFTPAQNESLSAFRRCFSGTAQTKPEEWQSVFTAYMHESPFGAGTSTELAVNVLLPLAYTAAVQKTDNDAASGLLRWYWTLKAANKYAHLQRKFPFVKQEYVWQQQGLLEYEAEVATPKPPAKSMLKAASAHGSAEMVMTLFEIGE